MRTRTISFNSKIIAACVCLLSVNFCLSSEEKNLYEKVSGPGLIVFGTVLEDDQKYALVSVEDVLKGTFEHPSMQVSFRKENFERELGEKKIEFEKGEKVILLLEPYRTGSGKVKKGIFSIIGKAEGKIPVSAESASLTIEAIRRFIGIQASKDQNSIWKQLKALLEEKNRIMVEAGFQEILKFRIASPEMIPHLLGFFRGKDQQFRLLAAETFLQLFEDERRKRSRIEGREEILREMTEKARGDPVPAVRVEAIRVLKTADAAKHREIFEVISKNDENQDVRYEAQRALYEIRSGGKQNE